MTYYQETATSGPPRLRGRHIAIAIVVVILCGLYFSGRLDHLMFNVGLNYKPCTRTGLGVVMCGDEIASYCNNLNDANFDPGQTTDVTCDEVGVTLTGRSIGAP